MAIRSVPRPRVMRGHPIRVIRPHPRVPDPGPMSAYPSDQRGQNWAAFVAVLFLVLGCFNLIDGVAALVQDDYFKIDELLFGDLAMWGVIYLVLGAVQLVTGFLVWRGSLAGVFLGIALAGLNALI